MIRKFIDAQPMLADRAARRAGEPRTSNLDRHTSNPKSQIPNPKSSELADNILTNICTPCDHFQPSKINVGDGTCGICTCRVNRKGLRHFTTQPRSRCPLGRWGGGERWRVFFLGYPGELGGANTEALHLVRLLRRFKVHVHLIPTWGCDAAMEKQLDELGCTTHHVARADLENVPGLAGSICIGMCNEHFIRVAPRLRAIGCPLVWVNCMTFLFGHEKAFHRQHGPCETHVFQSEFQRQQIEPWLSQHGYDPQRHGHLVRGTFDWQAWQYAPRPHAPGSEFIVGRVSRPDVDKWSSNTWRIYGAIEYQPKRALMLGMNDATHRKCGQAPAWAECLAPRAIPIEDYMRRLHCLLPVNGGARENWPRAGLEAMAAGVPIVAQDQWGWREMIDHGVTGFLGKNDHELASYAAALARDEDLRLAIIHNARMKLERKLADPLTLWAAWEKVFQSAVKAKAKA